MKDPTRLMHLFRGDGDLIPELPDIPLISYHRIP
jgi:hypothetical protein